MPTTSTSASNPSSATTPNSANTTTPSSNPTNGSNSSTASTKSTNQPSPPNPPNTPSAPGSGRTAAPTAVARVSSRSVPDVQGVSPGGDARPDAGLLRAHAVGRALAVHARAATQVEALVVFANRAPAHRAHTDRARPRTAHDAQDGIDEGGHVKTVRSDPHGRMKRS